MATANTTSICSLLLQTVFLSQNSVSDLHIDVSPTNIELGLTNVLEVNCRFNFESTSDMAAFISMIISRGNNSEQGFEELATLNDFSDQKVNVLTSETLTAMGVFSPEGESYLHLQYDYPTELQSGVYRCTVQGFDPIGHMIVMTKDGEVSAHKPTNDDWQVKIKELDVYTQNLEQIVTQMNNQIQTLDRKMTDMNNYTQTLETKMSDMHNYTQSLETKISDMSTYTRNLETKVNELLELQMKNIITEMFQNTILTYNNHQYYISRDGFADVNVSNHTCRLIGGYLVEINDASEYQAIRSLMNTTNGLSGLIISGTDEDDEGSWILPSTNKPLPYLDWRPGDPDGQTSQNCLALYGSGAWRMADWPCSRTKPNSNERFMCEVPQL